MAPQKTPYGLLSIFSFILAGIGYLVDLLTNTAGYLTLWGANNMRNSYNLDQLKGEQAQEVMSLYAKYQTEYYKAFYDWTIGPFNNVPLFLGIIFAITGIVLAILYFKKK